MTNEIWGAFLAGIGFALVIVAIFQIGLNIGIKISTDLLEGEYPAAFKFLKKNNKVAKVLPYVIGQSND